MTLKRFLLGVLPVVAMLAMGATVIVKISEFPNTGTLAADDKFIVASGSTNKHIRYDQLENLLAGSATNQQNVIYVNSNYVTLQFVTNQYVTVNYVDQTYVTNQYVSFTTNNYAYTTNQYVTYNTNLYSYVTNQYVTYNTNLYSYVTNQYVTFNTNEYAYITNLYVDYVTNNFLYTTNITAQKLYVTQVLATSGIFTNGVTNLALTASTVLQADAGKGITSIPNGSGVLTNDGAGVVGWTTLPSAQTNIGWAGVTNLQSAQLPSSVLTNDLADSQLSANVPLKDLANDFASSNSFAGTLAAKSFKTLPNSWAGPTNSLDLLASWVKYATYTPCAITGLLNKSASGKVVDPTVLTLTNAASTNITLYWTSAVRTGDGARSWVITNATEGKLSVEYDPNDSTNAVFRLFY